MNYPLPGSTVPENVPVLAKLKPDAPETLMLFRNGKWIACINGCGPLQLHQEWKPVSWRFMGITV